MNELKNLNDDLEIQIYTEEKKEDLELFNKISVSKVANYGVSLEPLIKNLFTEGNQSGTYRVVVKKGQELVKKADGTLIGTTKNVGGNLFAGQAELVPININPTQLALAIALSQIENKIVEIQETQKEILEFLVEKEKSKNRGNLLTLIDVQNNFKYNWDNDIYKINKHIQIQDIKKESEQSILFYRNKIDALNKDNKFLIKNKDVLSGVENLNNEFREYQLSLYLYSFSTYLEVLLLNIDNVEFIKKSYDKINEYSYKYRMQYTESYDRLEKLNNKAIEGYIFDGIASASNIVNKVVKKLPNKDKNKKNKINKFLEDNLVDKRNNALKDFTQNSSANVNLFAIQLKSIENIYSNDLNIIMDSKNIYLESK